MSLSTAEEKRMSGLVGEAKMRFFGRRLSASLVETAVNRG